MKKLITRQEITEKNELNSKRSKIVRFAKILTVVLCFTLIFATLTACGNGEQHYNENGEPEIPAETPDDDLRGNGFGYADDTENGTEDDEDSENDDRTTDLDARTANLENSMATFNRDDIMISAGDHYITWAEFYVHLFTIVSNITGNFEFPVDWLEAINGEITVADAVLEQVSEQAIAFLSLRYGAESLGVSLSQEDLDGIEFTLESSAEHYGGFEEFEQTLRWQYGFYDAKVLEDLLITERLLIPIMAELYGENAENLPDEVASAFAEQHGYMMAKHILILNPDDVSNRDIADELYERLRQRVGDDDFEEYFTTLMLEYSEDPGSIANPDGYLFQPWDMVEPFSAATMLLSPGEMSDIVETSFGYHIILRVPTDYDAVPFGIANMGMTHTIRQLAAQEDFGNVSLGWNEDINPQFSELFDTINLATIFAWVGD